MDDPHSTNEQLVAEVAHLRQKVAELEASELRCRQLEAALQKYQETSTRFPDHTVTVRCKLAQARLQQTLNEPAAALRGLAKLFSPFSR